MMEEHREELSRRRYGFPVGKLIGNEVAMWGEGGGGCRTMTDLLGSTAKSALLIQNGRSSSYYTSL